MRHSVIIVFFIACVSWWTPVRGQTPIAQRQVQRAIVLLNRGKYAEAEKILRQVVSKHPSYHEARYELALALSLQQKFQEALITCLPLCDTSLPKDQQRDHYYHLLGNLYAQQDDTTRADSVYQLGLKRFPTSARLHVELAIRQAIRGDLEEALESIESAISGDPTYPLSYYWGARFYRASTERIWALFYAEIFLNLRPNSPKADEMSTLWYNLLREVIEEFDQQGRIVLSREIRGNAEDTKRPFPEVYAEVLTTAARSLRFFRDFELPLASIDTLFREFLMQWESQGYAKIYPNILIERQQQLWKAGLLEPYVFVLAQHGKPMQFEQYAKQNRRQLRRLEQWISHNRLVITRENYVSRYRW
ncbi:MAG: tetratricopeptide repeat protein [Bacteroidota bacterium]|nr:tetratricopeptide repeat protein [Candidatus Kapabacteria bacterium]MCS7302396.1 tetratricopeptide repeat protein [Candidatus Kapabacteria bacterium]MCX7937130.1 tetratricopeptide repeat protein [Chlorobiota bacterium]MDW8074623.1 tetratricopeptide repeat protein [Bacteroidota bacterium]MDW8270901.1 tetratricopeptide repeat protein [Bacteroidota bacterium]